MFLTLLAGRGSPSLTRGIAALTEELASTAGTGSPVVLGMGHPGGCERFSQGRWILSACTQVVKDSSGTGLVGGAGGTCLQENSWEDPQALEREGKGAPLGWLGRCASRG